MFSGYSSYNREGMSNRRMSCGGKKKLETDQMGAADV